MLRRFIPLLLLITACSSSSSSDDTTAPPPGSSTCMEGDPGCIGWQTCPAEMTADPDTGCKEVVPPSDCAAGTMAVLGSAMCAPVGPASCAAGFQKAKSGWGCEAIVPEAACTGATRDSLGSTTCVPVGDCSAAFPPASATYFVSPGATPDATHFTTIAAAIAAAPAGSTIAVDEGTYAEGIQTKGSINIVGRCADKVHLVGTGLEVWGLYAGGSQDVSLSGVTLEDHYEGVRAQKGARVTLTDVVIEAPRSSGLIAWQAGSSIKAERVVIRNTKPEPNKQTTAVVAANADEGGTIELDDSSMTNLWEAGVTATNPSTPSVTSTVTVQRSIIRDVNSAVENSKAGAGVVVSGTSKGTVTESLILNVRRLGVVAFDPGSLVTVTSSVIQTTLEDSSGEIASGVQIQADGHVDLVDTSLRDHVQAGIASRGANAIATMTRGVVEATRAGKDGDFGMGAYADQGGAITLDTVALVKNGYYGAAGIDAKTNVKMTSVLVADTQPNAMQLFGRGVNIESGAAATLDEVTLVRNMDTSLFVRGETKDGARAHAKVTRLYVLDPVLSPTNSRGSLGVGVEQGATLDLDTAAVVHPQTAGLEINDTVGDGGHRAEVTAKHLIIRDPVGDRDGGSAASDILSGMGILSGSKLTLSASAITGASEAGILLANPTAVGDIRNVVIAKTSPGKVTGNYGHGLVAMSTPSVLVFDSIVRANQIGLAFDHSSAIVSSTIVADNAVGIHVQGDGFTLNAVDTAPDAPEPNAVDVTTDTQFLDNQTRVGSGDVPLPSNPIPATTP